MGFLTNFKNSFQRFSLKLYSTLIIRRLLPTIYLTFRVAILGSLPDANALSIASQMAWINILLEIIEEGLLQPLYHCFGSSLNDSSATKNKVKTGFIVALVIYSIFSCLVSIFADPLVTWMAQDPNLHDDTVNYIRLELIGIIASSLNKLLMLIMILHEWNLWLYISLFVQMICSMSLDYLLVSDKVANLGVNGVAYSSIITSFTLLSISIIICWIKLKMNLRDLIGNSYSFTWFRRWTRVGSLSAFDSFIRNSVYMIVVIRAMNTLNEQDSYWVTNTFIWNWLLLPALPLGDVLKQDVSTELQDNRMNHWKKTIAYISINIIICFIWLLTYPLWEWFIIHVLKSDDSSTVKQLTLILTPGYLFFIFGNLVNSVFYAKGRTEFLLLTSVVSNTVLVILFLLMIFNVINNSVQMVALIFGIGLIIGGIFSFLFYGYLIRRNPLL